MEAVATPQRAEPGLQPEPGLSKPVETAVLPVRLVVVAVRVVVVAVAQGVQLPLVVSEALPLVAPAIMVRMGGLVALAARLPVALAGVARLARRAGPQIP